MENGNGRACSRSCRRDTALVAPNFMSLRPTQEIDAKFLYYCYLQSDYRGICCGKSCQAAAGRSVCHRDYLKDHVAFPASLPEQQRIAAYLDASCAAIDAAVAAKRRQLETLDGVRKAIIHQAVTRGLDRTTLADGESGNVWIDEIPQHWELLALKRMSATFEGGLDISASVRRHSLNDRTCALPTSRRDISKLTKSTTSRSREAVDESRELRARRCSDD